MSQPITLRERMSRIVARVESVLLDADRKLTSTLLLRTGRILTWKLERRLARLTVEQKGFWAGAFADALAEGTTVRVAEQRAWEKLYENWSDLRNKV